MKFSHFHQTIQKILDIDLPPGSSITGEACRIAPDIKIDRTALAAYCDAFADYLKYKELADKTKPMLQTDKGNWVQNPLVGMKHKARDTLLKLAAEFGMTPSARSRVSAISGNGKDEPKGKLSRFFENVS